MPVFQEPDKGEQDKVEPLVKMPADREIRHLDPVGQAQLQTDTHHEGEHSRARPVRGQTLQTHDS